MRSAELSSHRIDDANSGAVLANSLQRLGAWLVERGFAGNDPHDALRSPIVRTLSFNQRLPGIVWVQLLRRSPVDFRRLLRVPPGHNPKAMGLFLASYVRRYCTNATAEDRARIDFFANWLREHRSAG